MKSGDHDFGVEGGIAYAAMELAARDHISIVLNFPLDLAAIESSGVGR